MGKLLEKFLFKMKKFRKFFWFLLLKVWWNWRRSKIDFARFSSIYQTKHCRVLQLNIQQYSSVQYLRNIKTPDSSIHNIIEYLQSILWCIHIYSYELLFNHLKYHRRKSIFHFSYQKGKNFLHLIENLYFPILFFFTISTIIYSPCS